MYQYAPKSEKKSEKLQFWGLLCAGLFCFGCSYLPMLAMRAWLQLGGVALLTLACMVLIRYLMRNYVYCIEAEEGSAPDFIIIEEYGKRRTPVCRISVQEIVKAIPIVGMRREELARVIEGRRLYTYIGEQMPRDAALLQVMGEEDEVFFIKISADEKLLACIEQFRQRDGEL